MKRVFIAISLPIEVKSAISASFKANISGLRSVPKKNLHLTLFFLGEKTDEEIKQITASLLETKMPKFNLELTGFGSFTDRILFVSTSMPLGLSGLYNEISNKLKIVDPSLHPHITVAKNKSLSSEEFNEVKKSLNPVNVSFQVNNFELMESSITKDGSNYSTIKSFKLN